MIPRMSYRANEGWYLDVQEPLPFGALKAAASYAFKVNADRLKGLVPGAKRDELVTALKDLQNGRVQQRIIAEKNKEYTLFKGE